jgi:mannitol-1-phosphate/altronate dehydrogenase
MSTRCVNSFHVRLATLARLRELERISGVTANELVNAAVERYCDDQMMRIAMGRAGLVPKELR